MTSTTHPSPMAPVSTTAPPPTFHPLSNPQVTPEAVQEILRIGRRRSPREALGLLAPDGSVIELKNSSPTPEQGCEADRAEVERGVVEWLVDRGRRGLPDLTEEETLRVRLIFWHTHPSGGVGPSRHDVRSAMPDLMNLVVTLPDGPAVRF